MKIIFLLFLLLTSTLQAEVVTIDVNEAKSLLNTGHLYLDVRTEEEFNEGHLEKALNIPYMLHTPQGMVKSPKFMDEVKSHCGKEDHIVVGCRSGVRSLNAATDLVYAGFKKVYNMGGGYIAWTQNGFGVTKPHNDDL